MLPHCHAIPKWDFRKSQASLTDFSSQDSRKRYQNAVPRSFWGKRWGGILHSHFIELHLAQVEWRLTLPHGFWCLISPLMVQESSFLQGNIPACLPLKDPHYHSFPPFPLLPQLNLAVLTYLTCQSQLLHKLIAALYTQVWMTSKFNPPRCLYLKRNKQSVLLSYWQNAWGRSTCSQGGSGCKGAEERKHSLSMTSPHWISAKENEAGIKKKKCPALSSASNSLPPPCGPSLICE